MIEIEIERIMSELRAEIDRDFFDVPFVAEAVREDLGLCDQDDIRRYTLEVICRLMEWDVYPGDYTLDDLVSGRGFQFRPGTPDDLLSWIESEWIAMGHAPTPEQPICWFALRSSEIHR